MKEGKEGQQTQTNSAACRRKRQAHTKIALKSKLFSFFLFII
jgi:hypothetical protein